MSTTLRINGENHRLDVPADMPLLWALRDHLGLTGTKYGCGVGACGACTVHIDGTPARACLTPVGSIGGKSVTTIEGLSADNDHPVQRAWRDKCVPQCGYCQSGQIMTAAALIVGRDTLSADQIRDGMAGNLCRCGTYARIREAVALAFSLSRSESP